MLKEVTSLNEVYYEKDFCVTLKRVVHFYHERAISLKV